MFVIETFLIFSVAAFHFTVMPRSVRANELVADMQFIGNGLKERQQVFL